MDDQHLSKIIKLIKDTSNINQKLVELCQETKNKNEKVFYSLDDADANLGYVYEHLFESLVKLCNNDHQKAFLLLDNN